MKQVYQNRAVCIALFFGGVLSAAQEGEWPDRRVLLVTPGVVFGENIQEQVRNLGFGKTVTVGIGIAAAVSMAAVNRTLGAWSPFAGRAESETFDVSAPHRLFFDFLSTIDYSPDSPMAVVPTFCKTPIPPLLCALLSGKITPADFANRATTHLNNVRKARAAGDAVILEEAIAACASGERQAMLTSVYSGVVNCLCMMRDKDSTVHVVLAGNGDVPCMSAIFARDPRLEELFGGPDQWVLSAQTGLLCPSEEFFTECAQRSRVPVKSLLFVGTERCEWAACQRLSIQSTLVDPAAPDTARVPVIEGFLREKLLGE